jgi:hypothetical protein
MVFEALKTGDSMLMRGPKHGNAFGYACLPNSVPEALSGYFGSSYKTKARDHADRSRVSMMSRNLGKK